MDTSQDRIIRIIKKLEELIPLYMKKEEEKNISNGNIAVCIIDEAGGVYGKVFVNNDKIRARESFRVAWIKASQVWLTGMKKKYIAANYPKGFPGLGSRISLAGKADNLLF